VVLTADDEKVVTKRENKAGQLVRKSVPNVKRGGIGKKMTRTHIKFAGAGAADDADESEEEEEEKEGEGAFLEPVSSSDEEEDGEAEHTTKAKKRAATRKIKKKKVQMMDADADADEDMLDLMTLEPAESSDEGPEPVQEQELEGMAVAAQVGEGADAEQAIEEQETLGRRDLMAPQLPVKKSKKEQEEEQAVPDLSETGRLFVRNLPFACSEKDLQKLFGKQGRVVECEIVRDTRTGLSSGYGFVRYEQPQHAIQALSRHDGRIFQGRLLHVLPARPERVADEESEEGGAASADGEAGRSRTFKAKKQAKERASAGSGGDERRWNALLVRADVAAAAAGRAHGLSKGEVLDAREGDQAAVRQTLAEAALIEECCASLREQGVCLDTLRKAALGRTTERSRTTLLAKNLPERADAEDLRLRFAVHGQVVRFAMPPSRAMALVELADPGQARKAFRALAYSRYRDLPLYLEWAPESVFTSVDQADLDGGEPVAPAPSSAAGVLEEEDAAAEAADLSALCVIYVKNLNFQTSEEQVRELFAEAGSVRTVSLAQARGNRRTGEKRSLGYGFVEFTDHTAAARAERLLHGRRLDDHVLVVRRSRPKADGAGGKRKRKLIDSAIQPNSKLLVRNVAFECSVKELRELFGAYGTLKQVRLPRKFDGTNRGYAFVEYLSKVDAEKAMVALSHTHLYGRHLVLEYARPELTIAERQAQAAAQLAEIQKEE
jgi:multiple RNA-binding domain-containing protein 1